VKEPLFLLAPSDLRALAAAVASGRLSPPFSPASVERYVNAAAAQGITQSLQGFVASGISTQGLSRLLELLATNIAERPPLEDLVDLVTTGPDCGSASTRDTSIVVRDLFHNAKDSVVVIGYAVRQGQQVFQALANRMTDLPSLQVRMCLDIQRDPGDSSAPSEIVTRFVDRFRRAHWPSGKRLPEIFYDPRSLASEPHNRASLHAKCIVIDARHLFVSSANFTEAGQQRNMEVGLLLESSAIAQRLLRFLDTLVGEGHLKHAFQAFNRIVP
jgi:phosphatidylserine/phosphatidylglycerophosphate/cardiolipin synthase-like enzyme